MTYVMSDLHGCYDEFISMLKLVDFNESDELIIVGDVVDRGSDSMKIIKHIINEDNITLLRGNHEDMMIDAFNHNDYFNHWIMNGGSKTYSEYLKLSTDDKGRVINFIKSTLAYRKIKINGTEFILSHAGVRLTRDKKTGRTDVDEYQDLDFMLWSRNDFYHQDFSGLKDKVLIVGHTPTSYHGVKDYTCYKKADGKVIDIDCGIVFGGRLCCIRLDDMGEFYIEKIIEEP